MSIHPHEEVHHKFWAPHWPKEFAVRENFNRQSENQSYVECLANKSHSSHEDDINSDCSSDSEDVSSKGINKDWNENMDVKGCSRYTNVRLFMKSFTRDESPLPFHNPVEEITRFCEQSSITYQDNKRVALLDDRNRIDNGYRRPYLGPLTAQQLMKELSKKRFKDSSTIEEDIPDAERRLIFINDLDASTIESLATTASTIQAPALQDMIYRHLMSKISLGVTIPLTGPRSFTLHFDLPYYALRESKKMLSDTRQKFGGSSVRKSHTLPSRFRSISPWNSTDTVHCLYEAQISVAVVGIDHSVWTAYCFVDTYYEHNECVDLYHAMRGRPDPLAAGILDADLPIWSPREYFLKIVQIRIGRVQREWQHILDNFEEDFKMLRSDPSLLLLHSDPKSRREARRKLISWNTEMVELLRQLIKCLSETVVAWDKFQRHDIGYFACDDGGSQTASTPLQVSLTAINKSFLDLTDILQRLRDLIKDFLQDYPQGLCGQLLLENNEASLFQQRSADNLQALTYLSISFIPFIVASSLFSMQGVLPFTSNFVHFTFVLIIFMAFVVAIVAVSFKRECKLHLYNIANTIANVHFRKISIKISQASRSMSILTARLMQKFIRTCGPSQVDVEMTRPVPELANCKSRMDSTHTANSSFRNLMDLSYSPLNTSDGKQPDLGGLFENRRSLPITDPNTLTTNSKSETVPSDSQFFDVQNPIYVRPPFSPFTCVRNMLRRRFRPAPTVDTQRIEWICKCGHELYADLSSLSQREINRIASILQCTDHQVAEVQGSYAMSILSGTPSPSSSQTNFINRTPSSYSSPNKTSTGSSSSTLLSPSPSSGPLNAHGTQSQSYLELCISTGQYTKTLCEIDLKNISCDGDLFEKIRREYFTLRKFRFNRWLLKPSGIHFVKFAVQDSLRVAILQNPLSIPPPEQVTSKRYTYSPCPLENDPPMPSDTFLHYLTCRAFQPTCVWLPRLPKKLEPSIRCFTGLINEGWGIHIIEGPNWSMISLLNLFMISVSGLAAGLWKLYMDDFQGAFGFAGWIVAVANAVLFVYIARWSRE